MTSPGLGYQININVDEIFLLTFIGSNFVFSSLTDHGEEERERHDFALGKLEKARDEWNKQ